MLHKRISRRKRKTRQGNAQIDMTPILDMTFLLLIAFIITFPALQAGVTVKLPQGKQSDPLPNNEPFVVSITAEGRIVVGKDAVTDEELAARAQAAVAANKDVVAHIRGDEAQAYGRIMDVIQILRGAKLTKFSLITTDK